MSIRSTRPEVRVTGVAFSPTGRSFCAASTEGLLIYSLDNTIQFDPFDLDVDVTPSSIMRAIAHKDYTKALVMAFRLNERSYVRHVYEHIPPGNIGLVTKDLPITYLPRLLRFVAVATEETPHLEVNLIWIEAILNRHGRWLKDHRGSLETELRVVQRAVKKIQVDLGRLADDNGFAIDFLLGTSQKKHKALTNGDDVDMDGELTIEDLMRGGVEDGVTTAADDGNADEDGEWLGVDN